MASTIRVALLGLGDVGQTFAENFLEKIQEGGMPIEIVAVADRNTESPIALGFAHSGVAVFRNPLEVASLGDKVDVIFDLSGDHALRQELRLRLLESSNRHTVVVPEILAKLLACFFEGQGEALGLAQVGY